MNIEDIKFKPIKKDITYYDVCIDIFVHSDRTTKGGFHIDNCGDIDIGPYYSIRNTLNKNNATNRKQLERLLALNQLLNIAEYYNKVHSDKLILARLCIVNKQKNIFQLLLIMFIHTV